MQLLQKGLNKRTARIKRLTFSHSTFPVSFDEIHIFFITDVGSKEIRPDIKKDIGENIDLIMIGGDLSKKGVPIKRVRQNLALLKQLQAPIYFVWGDQDYDGAFHELDACLLQEGVNILTNSTVNFESEQGDVISLIGLDNKKHRNVNEDDAFRHAKGTYTILVTHEPSSYCEMDKSFQKRIDLVLSGRSTERRIRSSLYSDFLISRGYAASLFRAKGECYLIKINTA